MRDARRWSSALLSLMLVLVLSVSAHAVQQEEKGVLARLWERIKARISRQKEVTGKPEIKPEKPKVEERKAEERKGKPAEKTAEKPSREEKEIPSKAKMIDTIKRRLEALPEIVDMIPGLSRKEETGEGAAEYRYAPPGNIAAKIEDLDEGALYNLYVKVNQQATILNTERINRQLRQQEQLRRLQQLQQIPRVPASPPRTPPAAPRTPPPTPQQPPVIPSERR